jgi:hypothetical protein
MERVKRRIFAGLATCALACGAFTAVAPAADAASTDCGSHCVTWMPYEEAPNAVLNSPGDSQGSIINLAAKANSAHEDFVVSAPDTTTVYYQYGIISAALADEWPNYNMYEYQYAPDGVDSDLCIGTDGSASDSTGLTLQPCGVSADTLWLPLADEAYGGFEPIVAGSDTSLNSLYVMTAGRGYGQVGTYLQQSGEPTSQRWLEFGGVL